MNKTKLKAVAQKYKLDLIVAFGSQVKGRAVAGRSDLDVAVRFANGAQRGLYPSWRLCGPLADAFQTDAELHVTILNDAKPSLLREVVDGLPLYQRTPTTFLRFWSYAMRRYHDNWKYFAMCENYLRERYG